MTDKQQLIVFGEDWGGLPSSTQHIIKQLSRHYQVTWINSLGLRSPKATWHDVKRIFAKAGRIIKQIISPAQDKEDNQTDTALHVPDDFTVVEPRYIPLLSIQWVRKINRMLLNKLLNQVANVSSDQRAVIWISLPNAVDALYDLDKTPLNDPAVIYYCCDDFSALNGVDHDAVTVFERELASQAGVIVATSDELVAKFPSEKTHMIPHGVDTELFYQPVPRAEDLPSDKPIAGFYGSIADWIDIQLLTEVAKRLPNWNFVLIGAAKVDVSTLQALDNVIFLGPKPHHDLPRYSQHWQASLLPFVLNEQIIASNPLKLREYMAAGQPIVSIDFPQVQQYADFIEIASGAEQFVQALERCLQQPESRQQQRQQQVKEESWSAVANKINGLIEAI